MRFTGAVQIRAAYMETGLTIPRHGMVVRVEHRRANVRLTFTDGVVKDWSPSELVVVTEDPCAKCGGLGHVTEVRMRVPRESRRTALLEPQETNSCPNCLGIGL